MDQRNLILAIVLSLAVLIGWNYFVDPVGTTKPPVPADAGPQQAGPQAPSAPGADPTGAPRDLATVIAESVRVPIDTDQVSGSLSVTGGLIDDLILDDYHVTVDPDSPFVRLLAPPGTRQPYFVEFGWLPADPTVPTPDATTPWTVAEGSKLTRQTPVELTWDNGDGLVFKRQIALDQDYLFTVTQTVENTGERPIALYPYALVSRTGTPDVSALLALFEGPIGVIDGSLEEISYSSLQDDGAIRMATTGGWMGITDKYWLVTLIPDATTPVSVEFKHVLNSRNQSKYQVSYRGAEPMVVETGQSVSTTNRLFAGAKIVALLDQYAEELPAKNLDRAVDFGWFYFLTKPLFQVLTWAYHLVGNFGVAIMVLTVMIRLVMFPLAHKSFKAMHHMRELQPEMQRLREQYGDDKMRMNQELMGLYKKEKINPAAGCLPILIQIPVFFALYKVLLIDIDMRHAPFFLWIEDLSVQDPTNILNLFGLIPWNPEQVIPFLPVIGGWPIIMGFTIWLQQRFNPQPTDPIQKRIFALFPFIFTLLLASFPAGLVIYWAWNNVLSIGQQWLITQTSKKDKAKREAERVERKTKDKPAKDKGTKKDKGAKTDDDADA